MDDVTQTPAHRKPHAEGLVAAWLCLVIAGGTTATFNIWNAVFSSMALLPGILEGVAPVALAMVVSHLVATSRAGKFLKSVTFAVMVGAMVLSVHATGVVVRPAAGPLWWLFGAVIDTAALVALQVLLSLKARAVREAGERAAAEAAAADERTALRAEIAALAAEVEPLREALAAAQRDAEQANARRETAERKLDAQKVNGRRTKPANGTRRKANAPANDPANAPAKSRPVTEVPDDFDARAEALEIYLKDPDISGKDLGESVGLTARWGQLRKAEFAAASAGLDGTNAPGPSGPS